jgi:uracil-DNA glycosylase family 4
MNSKLLKIDEEISQCTLCSYMVEHFPNSKTISFGKDNSLVIVGEAPANNGWRKSGIAWYDSNNKLLPSGIVMQKLLDIININLKDTYFIEAIKCYPKDRKYLKICGPNCRKYLISQLKVINPKIVLVLGNYATKTLLDIKYHKFSDIVGKEYNIDNIKIIPIYHPSPISPVGYKKNIPIFKKLKSMIMFN